MTIKAPSEPTADMPADEAMAVAVNALQLLE